MSRTDAIGYVIALAPFALVVVCVLVCPRGSVR